ncbi:hypothetical protein KAR91_56415 [Candidatus Pacearchaeota archaeon]|nr:hypothetical protein [Candidatus Pacearchaeota archaeon]
MAAEKELGFTLLSEIPVKIENRVRKKGRFILLDTHTPGYKYDICLDRCKSPKMILRWIHHLALKNWVDASMLHRFIELVCQEHNIDIFS